MSALAEELGYAHSFVVPVNGLSGGLAIYWNNNVEYNFVGQPSLHFTKMYIREGGLL